MIIGNPIIIGGGIACTLTINTSPGATVTAVLDNLEITGTADDSGVVVLRLRKEGTWTITASDGSTTKTDTVVVDHKKVMNLTLFPTEPTSYSLIDTYTTNMGWFAPEDGYYEIELQGASGEGGTGETNQNRNESEDTVTFYAYSGGSGGGGGCAISRVKMLAGDRLVLTIAASGGTTSTVNIYSSIEDYSRLKVVSGTAGGNATTSSAGSAGVGGTASGGNYANYNGGAGKKGNSKTDSYVLSVLEDNLMNVTVTASSPAGGAAGYGEGNDGGKGASAKVGSTSGSYSPTLGTPGAGKDGFVKIYRGNTNVVA